MKASFCKQHNKFRIIIPPAWTGTGKRQLRFFDTKPEAEAEIRRITGRGVAAQPKLTNDAAAFLQLVETEYKGDYRKALESLSQHRRMTESITKPGATLEQACEAYIAMHEEQSHPVTVRKYNSTVRRFSADVKGHALPIVEVTKDHIFAFFSKRGFKPGGTRKTQRGNLHAFFNWAIDNGYLSANPVTKVEQLDKRWNAKKEIVGVEEYRRILFVCAEKYPRLLPYFVLGGLAGIRRAEMISSETAERDPRLEWRDIDFKANKIRIRHEVAKETRAADRRRTIPLEPAAVAWLAPVPKDDGPVMAISQSTFQRERMALLDEIGLTVPHNALRNSYASYGASFRGLGDVARAMGDLESTIRQYYVDLVDDPELGRAWFDIRPSAPHKIVEFQKEVA